MIDNNVLEEFFVWEEKNLIEQKNNCLNNTESVHYDTTTEIKNDLTKKDWRDITDPKLRKKMRMKAYCEVNKDKRKLQVKAYDNNYYQTNKDKRKLQKKDWYEANKDKIKLQVKAYREANRDKRSLYNKNKKKTDIQYKINHNLRARLYKAINRNQKTGSAVSDLGCTVDELKIYLESKFQSGMTWNNYGKDGWHIDHIKPLASFDLTDRNQLLEVCHYTNLQPLWATDNLSKGDKII